MLHVEQKRSPSDPGKLTEMSAAELNEAVANRKGGGSIYMKGTASATGSVEVDLGCLRGRNTNIEIVGEDPPWPVRFTSANPPIEAEILRIQMLDLGGTAENLMESLADVDSFRWIKAGPLPSNVWRPKLKNIEVRGWDIEHLPDGILSCPELETLAVTGTRCSELPSDIADLKNLHTAFLSGNLLKDCPPLTRTREVDLQHNKLRAIPEWMSQIAARRKAAPPTVIVLLEGNPLAAGNNYICRAGREPHLRGDNVALYDDCLDMESKVIKSESGRVYDLGFNRISAVPPWMVKGGVSFVFHKSYGNYGDMRRPENFALSSPVYPVVFC